MKHWGSEQMSTYGRESPCNLKTFLQYVYNSTLENAKESWKDFWNGNDEHTSLIGAFGVWLSPVSPIFFAGEGSYKMIRNKIPALRLVADSRSLERKL